MCEGGKVREEFELKHTMMLPDRGGGEGETLKVVRLMNADVANTEPRNNCIH